MSKLFDQIWSFIKENPWTLLLVFGLLACIISAIGVLPIGKSTHQIDVYGRLILFVIGLLASAISSFKLAAISKSFAAHDDLCSEITECGVINALRNPTGNRQKDIKRLIEEEVASGGNFRLLAMSGYSYLNPNGDFWKHAGLSKLITGEKVSFEVVLQSPFSFFALYRAIANRVEHSH